ncbi:MAG: hypothetical protein PWP31_569 [Clostridia bacterium]|nr:hypothetical protein [Clostridia bacterium]
MGKGREVNSLFSVCIIFLGQGTLDGLKIKYYDQGGNMQTKGKIAALAEGALIAALTVVLVLSGYFVPPLQLLTSIVWTVPIIVLIVRRDFRVGLMATLVAGLVISFFTGPVNALLLFSQFASLGLVYGYLFKVNARPGQKVVIGAIVSLTSLLFGFIIIFMLTGIHMGGIFQQLDEMFNYTLEFYKQTGMLEHMARQGMNAEEIKITLAKTINLVKVLMPGIFISASFFAAFINYIVAEKVLKRLELRKGELPPFRFWQLPWSANWGVIAGLGLWQLGDYYGFDFASKIGINILYIYLPLLVGNGLAATSYILYRFQFNNILKWGLIAITLINLPIAIIFFIIFGLFDPFFSYRRYQPSVDQGE